jgi:hypothetical protein
MDKEVADVFVDAFLQHSRLPCSFGAEPDVEQSGWYIIQFSSFYNVLFLSKSLIIVKASMDSFLSEIKFTYL